MYIETADDLNKKFGHTFAFHDGILTHFEAFGGSNDGGGIVTNCVTGDGQSTATIPLKHIEPIVVNETFINNTKFSSRAEDPMVALVHFRRNPKRQWKRGLSKDNTIVSCPYAQLYSSFDVPLRGWEGRLSFKLINHLLKPEYPAWKQAFKLLPTYQAIALSPLFAIMLSNISKERYLIANTFGFIAEATEDLIKVRHEAALQELRDWVLRSGIQVSVEMDHAN